MTLPDWKDLSTLTRRSPKRIYNLIKEELDSEDMDYTPESVAMYKAIVSVLDDQSTPVAVGGANVVLTDKNDDTKTYSGTTGSAGGCTINKLPRGTYIVTATAEGMEDYTGESDVIVNDADITINITMIRTTD